MGYTEEGYSIEEYTQEGYSIDGVHLRGLPYTRDTQGYSIDGVHPRFGTL